MRAQPIVGDTVSKRMGLECIRELAEHETERFGEQHSAWYFLQFLPGLPSKMNCNLFVSQINLFLLELLWVILS